MKKIVFTNLPMNAVAAEVLVPHDAFLSAWDSFSVVEDCSEKIKLVFKQMTVIKRLH